MTRRGVVSIVRSAILSGAFALSSWIAGCSSSTSGPSGSTGVSDDDVACDPLSALELPVTLGKVLGVAKDAQGTIYLADEVDPTPTTQGGYRVFVSGGGMLFRRRVDGSGSFGANDYTLSFEPGDDAGGLQSLLIEQSGGSAVAMSIGPGDSKAFIGDAGPSFTSLTVLDPSAIAGLTLRNLPGTVTIEYVADVDDGNTLVVTRPTDDWTDQDIRVFYGTASAMVERPVTAFARGSDTFITFDVGGVSFAATFNVVVGGDSGLLGSPGPGSIDAGGGKTLTFVQRTPTPTALPGLTFACIHS